jgi:hypothetical protein
VDDWKKSTFHVSTSKFALQSEKEIRFHTRFVAKIQRFPETPAYPFHFSESQSYLSPFSSVNSPFEISDFPQKCKNLRKQLNMSIDLLADIFHWFVEGLVII